MKAEMNGVSQAWLRTKGLHQLNLTFMTLLLLIRLSRTGSRWALFWNVTEWPETRCPPITTDQLLFVASWSGKTKAQLLLTSFVKTENNSYRCSYTHAHPYCIALCVWASCLWNAIRAARRERRLPVQCSVKAIHRGEWNVMNKWWSPPEKKTAFQWLESVTEYRVWCADNVSRDYNKGKGWNTRGNRTIMLVGGSR